MLPLFFLKFLRVYRGIIFILRSRFGHNFSKSYISAKNEDNATKLSGYDPWGLQSTSRTSWMIHVIHVSAQEPSMSTKYPPSCHSSCWDIFMKFSGYLPWGQRTSFMTSWMTLSSTSPLRSPQCPLFSKFPPSWPPPSWYTSDWAINTKFSGYVNWGKKTSFRMSGITMSSMCPVRNPQHPPSNSLLYHPFLTHFPLRYQHEIFRVPSFG